MPYGEESELQSLVDAVFADAGTATNLDLLTQAQVYDASAQTLEVVELLPSGPYTRHQMADQLNSIVTAHGWSSELGSIS